MNPDYENHLGRQGFEILEKIGSGLSGGTYKALQSSLNRPVAVKFFDNSFSKDNPDLRKRFIRESRLLSELQHPSIPYVLTKGMLNSNAEEIPYMVMQYISGMNLDEYSKSKGKLDLDSVLHISFQLLDALDFVHKKGIVHRDIKPSNIMILNSGHCYLIDFSIGFQVEGGDGASRVTRSGDRLGSVPYMSPEQARDMKNVDGRSDLFSLTKVICELLTGRPEIGSLNDLGPALNSALKAVFAKACSYSAQDLPSKAICSSLICPDAQWSDQGYYRGPNFVSDCTNAFCTSCGHALLYKCAGCNHPIESTRFCGGCGTEQFTVPECRTCGSFLKKEDMNNDTATLGCTKCRRKAGQTKAANQPVGFDNFDEDIPF
jgi:serine/threonine protein kinase